MSFPQVPCKFPNSPLRKPGRYRLVQNDEMQGAQILRNEAYIEYVAVTRDEA